MTQLIQLPDSQAEYLLYFFGSSLLMGLVLLYFRVMLLPSRNWVFNRFFLLAAPLSCLLLPLFKWSLLFDTSSGLIPLLKLEGIPIQAYSPSVDSLEVNWIGLIYGAGLGILLGRLIFRLIKIRQLIRHFPRQQKAGYTLVNVSEQIPTSSFGRYIFWSPRKDWSAIQRKQVLAHEICHVRQRHSIDLIFLECLMIVAWFQPLLWVFRRVAGQNHEFLADQAALKQTDPKTYAHMLLAEVFGRPLSLVHSFFQSPISKRIKMLKPISGLPKARFRTWLTMPLLLIGMIAVSCTMTEPEGSELVLSQQDASAPSLKEEVEHIAVPLNMAELQKAIGYPKAAHDSKIEGMVALRVLVDTEGEYLRHEVVNEAPEVLIDAVEKAISQLKFKPSMDKGVAVKSWVTIPFTFKLTD